MSITAYIDESVHSGADLYDANQPVLVACAVWLSEEQARALPNTIAELCKAHRLPPGDELKGGRLLKNVRGRHLVRELLKAIATLQAPISVVGFQKAYMAAGVVVEDCADHAYNPAFDERFILTPTLTEPLVEKILRNSEPADLMELWRIRRGDDGKALEKAYQSFLFRLSLSQDGALAQIATQMMKTDFEDLWSAVQGARNLPDFGSDYSPNISAFNALLHGMDEQARKMGVNELFLIHDTQQQFQPLFTKVWDVISHGKAEQFHFSNGNILKFPTDRLKTLRFADSHDHEGIQLADVLSAATRVAVEDHMKGADERSAPYVEALQRLLSTTESFLC